MLNKMFPQHLNDLSGAELLHFPALSIHKYNTPIESVRKMGRRFAKKPVLGNHKVQRSPNRTLIELECLCPDFVAGVAGKPKPCSGRGDGLVGSCGPDVGR